MTFFGVVVGVLMVLDLFVPSMRDSMDGLASSHEVGADLLEHLLVAGLVAAVAFYLVLGRKRRKALKRYGALAKREPWELVEWSQRKVPVVRRTTSNLLAEDIDRSPHPAVAVVTGRAGTGRTSFIVGLVQDLAARGLIPIPVLAARDGTFDVLDLASRKFSRHIDPVLNSDREADEIWHAARATRDVVILVDGLDDEVVETLSQNEDGLQTALASLADRGIAVVLATTRDLPLGNIVSLREDLDLLSGDEVERYLHAELEAAAVSEVREALKRTPDPVDGSLVPPFYLELLVALQKAGLLGVQLPAHRDRWREAVLARYLEGIATGTIAPHSSLDPDGPDSRTRGQAAVEAARTVARKLRIEEADLTVELRRAKLDTIPLRDAVDLNLLAHGAQRVGFADDDLASHLAAATVDDPCALLGAVATVACSERFGRRRDRHVLNILVFWHLRLDDRRRREAFDRLLGAVEQNGWTRPAVIAAVVRIASACEIDDRSGRIAAVVNRCLSAHDAVQPAAAEPESAELLRLVRALSDWPDDAAHRLLWRLATTHDIQVEWTAAKAFAATRHTPEVALQTVMGDTLERAEQAELAVLSTPTDTLGNELASLAWILPAIREMNELAETQLERVTRLCLDPGMSPLRGEMSLAQGLKFAIVNERAAERNVEQARELLTRESGRPRFWHARLVLVQALLAHAWRDAEAGDAWRLHLSQIGARESHPLVRRGIQVAQTGLGRRNRASNADDPLHAYMWIHERDAVRWVEQGKADITQLAADVVLLSNMTYRLRTSDARRADLAAADTELPGCIRRFEKRSSITNGCSCQHKLCEWAREPVVIATRARFSESFCREQARLAVRLGMPPWMAWRIFSYWGKPRLEQFWVDQARYVQRGYVPDQLERDRDAARSGRRG